MNKIPSTRYKIVVFCLLCIASEISLQASEILTMGIFPRRNTVVTVDMFTPLSRYISLELGINVKLETAKTFSAFWKGVVSKRYDIVHFNQLQYLLSHKTVGYNVFAKNEEFGRSSLKSSIIVRKDSGLKTIQDLKGKTIIFGGGEHAMISFVGVKLMLMENGLRDTDYHSIIARNPPNSSLAVYFRKAAAGGVGDIALLVPTVTKRVNANELKYLVSNHLQSHLPWAFSPKVSEALKERISEIFIRLPNSPEGVDVLRKMSMTGIQSAVDEDYDESRYIYQKYKKLLN